MSQTITIADATATDLKTALAGTAPVTPPPPAPAPTVTQPFVVDKNNPLAVLVTSPDGPLLMLGYDSNTKSPWLYLRSYLVSDPQHGVYSGAFFQFQARKTDGSIGGAVTINGGYVNGTVGAEQGDLDVVIPVDGTGQATFSMSGRYTPPGTTTSYPPGFMCWPPDLLRLGGTANRYAGAGLTILPVRPGMPAGAIGCVDVGGGFVPVFA